MNNRHTVDQDQLDEIVHLSSGTDEDDKYMYTLGFSAVYHRDSSSRLVFDCVLIFVAASTISRVLNARNTH